MTNLSELEALVGRATQEDLADGGRYFAESCDDLTKCRHYETGEYQNAADGELIEWLWNHRHSLLSTIRSQEAALVEAREALKPFAKIAASVLRSPRKGFADDYDWVTRQDGTTITFGHLRRAASALSKLEGGE
jgi:hypothetical protein